MQTSSQAVSAPSIFPMRHEMTRCAFLHGFAEVIFLALSRRAPGSEHDHGSRAAYDAHHAFVCERREHDSAARRDHRREPPPDRGALRRQRGARRSLAGLRATYRELWDATSRLARALIARGIQRGDRVGIWSPNRFEWVVLQFATARVGAILVNINPAYKTCGARVRAQPVRGAPAASSRAASARPTTWRCSRRCGSAVRRSPRRSSSTTDWERARRPRRHAITEAELAAREADAPVRRPDQHPVHVGHDRASPRARRSRTTTS